MRGPGQELHNGAVTAEGSRHVESRVPSPQSQGALSRGVGSEVTFTHEGAEPGKF